MSGILAVIGQVRDSRVQSALSPLRYLGGEREQAWREEDALVVVTRKEWQLDHDFSGPVLVLESPDLVVGADASLFDTVGLARQLSTAGVKARGDTPSHFIEAAYRAWGPAMVEHLNGDYAFVIWDRAERRLLAARDPFSARPLFWTPLSGGIAVASSCRALAELRGTSQELNLAYLGGQVAGMSWSIGGETAYQGVDPILPGRRAIWQGGNLRLETWWHPRRAPERRPSPTAEAAEELRELLCTAVSQRLSRGTTTVWMSGGWDSTAVFAAGQHALAPADRGRLRPVSISYPVGDPGFEDDFIKQVAGHWNADVTWLQSEDLRLLDGLEERVARSDEPPAHLYELWNRGLAQGTRAAGSRITLDGCGGDNLFQVSDIILADLLRRGKWLQFAQLARSRRAYGRRYLLQLGLLPFAPDMAVRLFERMARRYVPRHYMERPLSGWVRKGFLTGQRLRERDLAVLRAIRGSSFAHTESLLYLSVSMPIWSWGGSFMRGPLLEEGIEARSPLLDLKVVEFALGRPIAERFDGTETKRLLRLAMGGLLPPTVLAPRSQRTGITVGFSKRRMREAYPGLIAKLFGEPLLLADMGIVEPAALRSAADRYLAGDNNDFLRLNLFQTIKIELWLRGRVRGVASAEVERPAA